MAGPQAHPAQAVRRSADGRRCLRHQPRDHRAHGRARCQEVTQLGVRGGRRDRRRQHLPRRGRRLGRHGPRHRRLHGHAGHRDERAGAGRHDAPGGHDGARDVGDRHRAGGRALRAAEGAAVPRRRQGRDLRRRHRQPVLHHRHRRRAARRRDRRRDRAEGDQGRRRLHRRPEEGPDRDALHADQLRRGDHQEPAGHGRHRVRAVPRPEAADQGVLASSSPARSSASCMGEDEGTLVHV